MCTPGALQEMDQLITEGRKAKLPIFEIAQVGTGCGRLAAAYAMPRR